MDGTGDIFYPCPDKFRREIFGKFKGYISYKNSFKSVNCCGMGGLAKRDEPGIYANGIESVRAKNSENPYTYCATCAGNFTKNGIENVRHLTSEFLGVSEKISKSYAKNVVKFKFYKRRNYEKI